MGQIIGTSTQVTATTSTVELQTDIGFTNVILIVIAAFLFVTFLKTFFDKQ